MLMHQLSVDHGELAQVHLNVFKRLNETANLGCGYSEDATKILRISSAESNTWGNRP